MDTSQSLLIIVGLICLSALLGSAEISVAASQRVRLKQMLDAGDARAARVMAIQDHPGNFFTAIQIGQNAVGILAGLVGDSAFVPVVEKFLYMLGIEARDYRDGNLMVSFVMVTSLFIMFTDLLPKRMSLARPEQVAVRAMTPMRWIVALLTPVVWFFSKASDLIWNAAGGPASRDNRVTPADILAMSEAGALAGVLDQQEHRVIENVIELDSRSITSAMTARESVVYFLNKDDETLVRARIAQHPHSTYLVCEGDIDHVLGVIDSKDLLNRVLNDQPISLMTEACIRKPLMVPDRLSLYEMLQQFRANHADFAVIMNEYSLVVGIITINDVMSTVMADLVGPVEDEAQILRRDEHSWLIDGAAPIPDVLRALELATLPREGEYETLAGFLMEMLRRIPRRTDVVEWGGFRFEVLDVDSHRIDQVMVTRMQAGQEAASSAATPA